MDLRGVNEALRHRSPSEVVLRLNRFYEQATRAVISRDGTLDKLLADEVVAFFGAPFNDIGHERRAVEAGLEIVSALTGFWEHEALVGGAVGTGLAFVGNVGEGETRDYTAVGRIVNQVTESARQARPGELLILATTYDALGDARPGATVRTIQVPGERESLGVHVIAASAPPEARTGLRRYLATILSLDLVGSTDIAARRGDAAWRDLLARHYSEIRGLLLRHGGTEIDTAGDGLLATFAAPVEAIRFAREAQRADRELGLVARVGIHTGEVEQDGPAIRGIAVVIASRICALAQGDEVLVSGTVRELAAGSEIAFADRGTHQLKGVPDARAVYAAQPSSPLAAPPGPGRPI